MSQDDRVIYDVYHKIEREKNIIQGIRSLKASTDNVSVQQKCDSNIREAQKNIAYLEETMRQLKLRKQTGAPKTSPSHHHGPSDASTVSVGSASSGSGSASSATDSTAGSNRNGTAGGIYAVPRSDANGDGADDATLALPGPSPANAQLSRPRPNFTRLDLLKYDTPYLGPRIQLMMQQLEFKVSVEKQYREGIEKMQKLYQIEGDRRSRAEAEAKRIESMHKVQLLKKALKRYSDMHIDIEEEFIADDNESLAAANIRRPLTGNLHISCHAIMDVDHVASSRGSKAPESFITVKVEDQNRARTRYARNERWNEEFDIAVDKANEIEIAVYDRSGDHDVPVALTWLRISDIAEAIRRKKVEAELNKAGWVSASNVKGAVAGVNASGDDSFNFDQSNATIVDGAIEGAPAVGFGGAPLSPTESAIPDVSPVIDAWFILEPVGQIHLSLGFEKSNRGPKRAHDGYGGLGRQGAIRQKKEEVHEVHGHKFVQQQFYNIMRCALCGDFLKYSAGYQCQDCRYTCHKKCYPKVVTKCISKASTEADPDEEKLNHRIPHRFEPTTNMGANWCCHCGYILPLGKKNVRKCTECSLTCHPQCSHLVPDFCGMSMEMANQILSEIKSTKIRQQAVANSPERMHHQPNRPSVSISPQQLRTQPLPIGGRQQDQEPTGISTSPFGSSVNHPAPPRREPIRRRDVGSGAPAQAAAMALQGSGGRPAEQQPPAQAQSASAAQAAFSASSPERRPPQQQSQQQAGWPSGGHDVAAAAAVLQQQQQARARQQQQQAQLQQQQAQQQLQQQRAQQQQAQHQQRVQDASEIAPSQGSVEQPVAKVRPVRRRKVGLDDFNFLAVLGKGNFGKVMLAESKGSKQLYAIKVLKKDFIIEHDEVDNTRSEKNVLLVASRERHPFLINLNSCFQTENRIYFVMEYVSGGDLMWHIQKELFTPRRAQFYAAEVLLALKYFHDNGVIYRDLKLDNILLTLDGHVKIADYGLCKEEMWYGKTTCTFCGTPEFMAPEILLDQRYGRAVDWWAFGVLIYQMLLGKSPFRGEDDDEVFDAILSDEPLYPIHMPRDSVSILQELLTRDPTRRLGSGPKDAEDVMAHPYFSNINFDDIYNCRVAPPFVPKIESPTDVRNFDNEFTSEAPALTPVTTKLTQKMQEAFRGFSYVNGDAI